MKYTLPEEARQYVLFQRTDLLPKRPRQKRLRRVLVKLGVLDDGYEDFVRNCAVSEGELIDEQYFRAMRDNANSLLPSIRSDTSSILDIGCGIAALDIFLYEPLNEPKLYLLDKTAIDPKVWYNFKDKGSFYNSLELAKETLSANGVPEDKIELLEAPDDGEIDLRSNSVDLVVSTLSWGFHYPVSTYLHSVTRILSDDGMLLIDVRKGSGGEAELETFFHHEVVHEGATYRTLKCTLK